MESNLSILSEKQKEVYLLREKNMSFAKISEKLGISETAVRGRYTNAIRRIKEYEHYNKVKERNTIQVAFPITRGELLLIYEGLRLLTKSKPYAVSKNVLTDIEGRKSYKRTLIDNLIERAEEAIENTFNSVSKDEKF